MLKIEPREADQLVLPSALVVEGASGALSSIRPQVRRALAQGQLLKASSMVDNALMTTDLGISAAQLAQLRSARLELFNRRVSRNAEPEKTSS